MSSTSQIPMVSAAIIISITLISGPAIGGLDLVNSKSRTTDVGTGNVTAESVSLPGTVVLQKGRYGAGGYSLQVPDAEIKFAGTHGRPTLTYEIEIPALNHSRESVYFLKSSPSDHTRLTLERETFEKETITRDRYDGYLRVNIRSDETNRVIERRNVTVVVRR